MYIEGMYHHVTVMYAYVRGGWTIMLYIVAYIRIFERIYLYIYIRITITDVSV
jgi:hypothetical protein